MDVAVADELAIGDPVFVDQVRGVLRRHGVEWRLARTQVAWCLVAPAELDVPAQGWKLHVSATPLSAPLVLAGAAEVLVARRCPFKFAATMSVVGELVSPECPRGSGGKFITAYPRDDDQFCLLAEELHAATEHLPGPAILSDRRYRPGSLVHYRYGVLTGVTALGNDGSYQTRLRAPDGTLVRDERNPWFAPPSWARCPLPDEAAPDTSRATSGPVLLDGRFVVREAIQHANKGGVYRAVDKVTGADVVVKQARPHVVALPDGSDGRDSLRREARMLERLAPLGLTPRLIRLFAHDDNLFLAEEAIDGVSLAGWLSAHLLRRLDEPGATVATPPLGEVVRLAIRLVEMLAAVHGAGVVLRDLSPYNIMVTAEGEPRLVDLEHAGRPGERMVRVGTPGYAGHSGPVPRPARRAVAARVRGGIPDHAARPAGAGDRCDRRPSHRRSGRAAG